MPWEQRAGSERPEQRQLPDAAERRQRWAEAKVPTQQLLAALLPLPLSETVWPIEAVVGLATMLTWGCSAAARAAGAFNMPAPQVVVVQ